MKRTFNGGFAWYYIYDGERPILGEIASGWIGDCNIYGKGIDEILEHGGGGVDDIWHWTFYNQDANGNVTHLTDATGAVVEKYQYDAFGAPIIYNGAGAQITQSFYYNRFLFTGREYESSFGIYHYRARAYHPRLGRFTSEDPKLFDAGDYNLFRYCHNDPLDLTDPMGLETPRQYWMPTTDRLWAWQKHFDSSEGAISMGLQGFQVDQSKREQSNSRRLTSGEVKLARSEYSNSIDYDAVGVFHRSYFPGQPADRAMTPNGNMYFTQRDPHYHNDFSKANIADRSIFIHEMMHVYQFQHGMSTMSMMMAKLFHGGYEYFPVTKQRTFRQYGIEQQAMIMQDHFLLRNGFARNESGQPSLQWYESTIPFNH